ncbi:hypothetical protein BH18ACT1_BH18ACT1_09370 [soil metagenome]
MVTDADVTDDNLSSAAARSRTANPDIDSLT